MLKGTESGLLIQIKDIEKDIKELELKLKSKMFITRIDFFIYPQDKEHFQRLETLLKGYGFKLFIAEERANRTTIRMQEKQARIESEKAKLNAVEEKKVEVVQVEKVKAEKILFEKNQTDENQSVKETAVEISNTPSEIKSEESEETTDLFTFFSNFDTLTVQRTLRSGQRIEHSGNIVIVGDVNSGAEVYAEGDIYVFGKIKGTVHAGRSGNPEAVIIGFSLESQMVRIGTQFLDRKKTHKSTVSHYERAYLTKNGELEIEEIGK